MLPKAVSLGMSDADEPLKVCVHYPVHIMAANQKPRTLIQMSQSMLQIQKHSSISLVKVVPMLQRGKLPSVLSVGAGVNFPHGSISLRVTGFLDSLAILRQSHRQGPPMFRNGYTRI